MNKARVYIAGKVTGEDPGLCFSKFAAAEYQLKQQGYEVVNPMRLCNTDTNWNACMKMCLKAMLTCESVFLLPDWQNSIGATMEVMFANVTGINTVKNIHELNK